MKSTSKILSIVFLLFGCFVSQSASAQMVIGSPASHCQPGFPHVAINSWAYNTSPNTWGYITCGFGLKGKATTLYVDTLDSSSAEWIHCQLSVWNFTQTTQLYSAGKNTGWEESGNRTLTFNIPAVSGYGYLLCSIPETQGGPYSGIRGITYGPM